MKIVFESFIYLLFNKVFIWSFFLTCCWIHLSLAWFVWMTLTDIYHPYSLYLRQFSVSSQSIVCVFRLWQEIETLLRKHTQTR